MAAAADRGSILKEVKHVILVLSGKGGVGKSTVAVQLALSLQLAGKKVGLLDVDLCGPSIPRMLNLEGHSIHQSSEGYTFLFWEEIEGNWMNLDRKMWIPVYTDSTQNLGVMSIAFLLENRNDAIVWRGPKKTVMIKQFLSDVCWSNIDYLIIDTPPGTSDEHIAVMENLQQYNPDGAILVTTPQAVSVGDVRREVTFCRKTNIPILGIVENMSGFVCPTCQDCTNIFSKGGGEALAKYCEVPFLGSIPLDPNLASCTENGSTYLSQFPMSLVAAIFKDIVKKVGGLTDV